MLNIPKYRFMLRLHRYQHDLKSAKGKCGLSPQSKQVIHDNWLANSNVTVDRRNGHDIVTISKSKYDSKYSGIMIPSNIDVDFNSTKRGTPVVKATRYLATKSVRAIQQELGSGYSIGSVYNYRPFL